MSSFNPTIKRPPNKRRPPLTPWELPDLLRPVHRYRRTKKPAKRDRKHFAAILSFVYRNRFAVSSQIQRRFADYLPSDRTARRHLAEMESLGFLATAPTRSTSPLWPKVYFAAGRGLRKLRKALAEKNQPGTVTRVDRAVKQGYSADHVLHEVLTTEFLLALWEAAQKQPDLEILTVQRRAIERHPSFAVAGHRETRLKPDAVVVLRQAGGMMCYFVELDLGTMSVRQLRGKFRRYAAWAASEPGRQYLIELYRRGGAKEPRPTFRILWVAKGRTEESDSARLEHIWRAAQETSPGGRVWATTVGRIRAEPRDTVVASAAIWNELRFGGTADAGPVQGRPCSPFFGGTAG